MNVTSRDTVASILRTRSKPPSQASAVLGCEAADSHRILRGNLCVIVERGIPRETVGRTVTHRRVRELFSDPSTPNIVSGVDSWQNNHQKYYNSDFRKC